MISSPAIENSTERPLALRMRGDLEFRPQQNRGTRCWAVKDPVGLKYFHLGEEEYTLLQMLDGRTSLARLKQRLDQAFAPRRIAVEQIQGYLATLHRQGLIQSDAPGQGRQLALRREEKRRRGRFETLASLLCIRFPGVNPKPLLDIIYPVARGLFSPLAFVLAGLLAVAALLLVAVEFRTIEARLPDVQTILSASNLPWLALSLAGVKILHELGHATACRRYGGECHEIGAMLLVFTPCLYCNVSDAWMLPGKWQRIAISAAGIYVELILAAVCTLLWYVSQPGTFNAVCLNVVLICSLGTVLLNGNPLMRYDGYFILADLVEVPNLRAEANAALHRVLARYGAGVELPPERLALARHSAWLVTYSIAAGVYRLVIVGLVLWTLDQLLRPLHLEVLVLGIAGVAVGGMLWGPLESAWRWLGNPLRRGRFAPLRVALSTILVLGALAAVAMIPLPRRVSAPVVLESADAQRVYVTVDGMLVEALPIGQTVDAGQEIARLDNPAVRLELARLSTERDQQRLLIANLNARRLQGGATGAELPAAQAALADLERRLEQTERDARRLSLSATRGGTILPAPNVPEEVRDPRTLPRWTGTPLDPRNHGATLTTGTLVCLVGDAEKFEAVLHVDQRDVELVQSGQSVAVRLDHLPDEVLQGHIVELAKLDLEVMPRELAAAGDVPGRADKQGLARPLDAWYQARVRFDEQPAHLVARMHGRAKIEVASQTLGERLIRWIKQTFAR